MNPTVLFEVLSRTTRDDDDGWKWAHYRRIPSLRAYVMIDPDAMTVMSYQKHDDGSWRFEEHASGRVAFAPLAIGVEVSELFDGLVDLPADPEAP